MEARSRSDSLWWIAVSPALWALHLLVSYAHVAIYCGKIVPRSASLGSARVAVLVYTAVALAGVVAVGTRGYLRERSTATPKHADTPGARRRFLGHTTVLLSALSAIAIVYEALPVLVLRSCR